MGDEPLTNAVAPGGGVGGLDRAFAWSRRAQVAFIAVAMPVLVFLLVGAPYLLAHYVVNPHWRFNYIPPSLGGDRALEGHWTDAPLAEVRRVKFAGPWRAFGWVAVADDHVTNVFPTVSGTVTRILAKVGDSVVKDAPLFSIRSGPVSESHGDASATPDDIVVSSPVSGQVMRLDVATGQRVKIARGRIPPTPAASVVDPSVVWLTIAVDEGIARSLRPGDPLEIRPFALPGRVFTGKISSLSRTDDKTMPSIARIVVENPAGDLKPNMLATISASAVDDSEALAAPESAVVFENGFARVFIGTIQHSGDNVSVKLAARNIRVGRVQGGLVEALDGLQAGDKVEASDALFIDRAANGY